MTADTWLVIGTCAGIAAVTTGALVFEQRRRGQLGQEHAIAALVAWAAIQMILFSAFPLLPPGGDYGGHLPYLPRTVRDALHLAMAVAVVGLVVGLRRVKANLRWGRALVCAGLLLSVVSCEARLFTVDRPDPSHGAGDEPVSADHRLYR